MSNAVEALPNAASAPGGAGTAVAADVSLAASRVRCAQITRSQARNFYYGLKLLPEPKRSDMFALYAYMRLADDIADADDGRSLRQRLDDLDAWQERTRDVLAGRISDVDPTTDPGREIWPAFADMAARHAVPVELFDEAVAGQRQDLEPVAFETFDDLRTYCRRVAGIVGVASIYVWGFEGGAETEALAVDRGIAFQLTNVLRDLREDARNCRCYLPRDELAAHGVTEEELRAGPASPRFQEMMRFQIARAEEYYQRSRELESRIARDSRATLSAITAIYRGLLTKIADQPDRVLRERVSLSLMAKLRIGWKACRAAR